MTDQVTADTLHELLHTTHVLQDMLDRHIVERIGPGIPGQDELKASADAAAGALGELYQTIGVALASLPRE